MEDKNNNDGFFDLGGTIYSVFLHFMLFSQMYLMVKDAYSNEILSCLLHVSALLYFIFRIHIFEKIKHKANSAGHSIIDYLRDKYGA